MKLYSSIRSSSARGLGEGYAPEEEAFAGLVLELLDGLLQIAAEEVGVPIDVIEGAGSAASWPAQHLEGAHAKLHDYRGSVGVFIRAGMSPLLFRMSEASHF